MSAPLQCDVLIVGGGLAGLRLAQLLQCQNIDWHLIEANSRLGGRILTEQQADLGPTWFWPGQPRMAALLHALNLQTFPQHTAGNLVFEDAVGNIRRDIDMSTTGGAMRVKGGIQVIIDTIAQTLPAHRIHLNHRIETLALSGCLHVGVNVADEEKANILANRTILALPPRVVADQIAFSPDLEPPLKARLSSVQTWMAGHAKAVALYDTPFWRGEGLSGDGISQKGPLSQIHDASPAGGPGALFGFFGMDANDRAHHSEADLKRAVEGQLVSMFGPSAANPKDILIKDWFQEKYTAVSADAVLPTQHPAYGPIVVTESPWTEKLFIGSTETASVFGGYLEGALEAAEAISASLISLHNTQR